jgi:hypothetical protein
LPGVTEGVETARVTTRTQGVETAGVTTGTRVVELVAWYLVGRLRSSAEPP